MSTDIRFGEIEDRRHQGYVEHKLHDVLIIITAATLCGISTLGELVSFTSKHKESFKKYFDIDKIPSKSTFSRFLLRTDGRWLAQFAIELMQDKAPGEVILQDDKSIHITAEGSNETLQILAAHLRKSGIIPPQEKITEEAEEIAVFQEISDHLKAETKITNDEKGI